MRDTHMTRVSHGPLALRAASDAPANRAPSRPTGGDPTSPGAADVQVTAAAFRFMPGEDYSTTQPVGNVPWPAPLRIASGTKLLFVNLDVVPHTLTADGCADGAGFHDPAPPPPLGPISEAFDETVAPMAFGQPAIVETGPCWFDSRGVGPNAFTDGPGGETEVDTSGLPPGDYKFHCVVHDFMQGTLHIDRVR